MEQLTLPLPARGIWLRVRSLLGPALDRFGPEAEVYGRARPHRGDLRGQRPEPLPAADRGALPPHSRPHARRISGRRRVPARHRIRHENVTIAGVVWPTRGSTRFRIAGNPACPGPIQAIARSSTTSTRPTARSARSTCSMCDRCCGSTIRRAVVTLTASRRASSTRVIRFRRIAEYSASFPATRAGTRIRISPGVRAPGGGSSRRRST